MQSLSALADGLWAWNYMIKIAYSFLFFSFSFVYVLTVDFKNIVIWYFFFLFIYIQHLVYYWYPRMDFWKFSSVIRIITTFKILSCLMSMIPSCFLSICHLVVSPFLKKNLMLFLFSFLVLHIYIYIYMYIHKSLHLVWCFFGKLAVRIIENQMTALGNYKFGQMCLQAPVHEWAHNGEEGVFRKHFPSRISFKWFYISQTGVGFLQRNMLLDKLKSEVPPQWDGGFSLGVGCTCKAAIP